MQEYLDKELPPSPPKTEIKINASVLEQFPVDSYQRFIADMEYQAKCKTVSSANLEQELNNYEKACADQAERMKRVKESLSIMEEAEKTLVERGAKTFSEIYPENEKHPDKIDNDNYNRFVSAAKKAEDEDQPSEVKFTFRVPDLNEETEKCYMEM